MPLLFFRATHPLTVSLSDTVTPDLGVKSLRDPNPASELGFISVDSNVLNPFAHKILAEFLSVRVHLCVDSCLDHR